MLFENALMSHLYNTGTTIRTIAMGGGGEVEAIGACAKFKKLKKLYKNIIIVSDYF